MKKRILSLVLALMFVIPLCIGNMSAVPAPAAPAGEDCGTLAELDVSTAAEIQSELAAAEEVLGGPCKLKDTETTQIGNNILESRLYVLDEPASRSSGKIGGVSSHVWRDAFSSTWKIKVIFSAWFYYNGTNAICIPDEVFIWHENDSHEVIDTPLNTNFDFRDGSTAKASCRYSKEIGGVPDISGTIRVTCSKTGDIGIVSEEDHVIGWGRAEQDDFYRGEYHFDLGKD